MNTVAAAYFFSFVMILSGTAGLNAQQLSSDELNSLYSRYISSRLSQEIVFRTEAAPHGSEDVKCGFGLSALIRLNFSRFSSIQQKELLKVMQRPEPDTSIISPSGFFRIHFNKSGPDIPAYDTNLTVFENAMLAAAAADSAYNFEVNFLGYPPPPPDNGEGGDDRYDIYIVLIGNYGITETDTHLGNERYTSFIRIHPNYVGFYSDGLDGMRVTVAHELHHAIQMGNYTLGRYDTDGFFYEMTSTAMEEFVYDSVNDYYAYMRSYFFRSDQSLASSTGYNTAIWILYLKDKFGYNIIRRQWELLQEMRALDAINTTIFEAGSSLRDELNTFGLWTYFTGDRFQLGVKQGLAFEEGNSYPEISAIVSRNFSPPEDIFDLSLFPVSNSYLRIFAGEDTLGIVITNSDVIQANSDPNVRTNFTYGLYDHQIDGGEVITNLYIKHIESSNPVNWKTTEILNDSVIIRPSITDKRTPAVFPLPYIYGKSGDYIRFPVSSPKNMNVDFNVYTIGMELVYSGRMVLFPFNDIGGYVVSWFPVDSDSRRLSSGVYLFVIKSGDDIQKGKFVVFNE